MMKLSPIHNISIQESSIHVLIWNIMKQHRSQLLYLPKYYITKTHLKNGLCKSNLNTKGEDICNIKKIKSLSKQFHGNS